MQKRLMVKPHLCFEVVETPSTKRKIQLREADFQDAQQHW